MDSRAKGDPRGEFPRNLSSAEDNANEIPLAGAEIKRDAGLLIHAIYNFLSRTIGSATATRSNYSTKFINGRGNSCSRVLLRPFLGGCQELIVIVLHLRSDLWLERVVWAGVVHLLLNYGEH